jgi:hypothetical protein
VSLIPNTFTTFTAIGNREDLANAIYNISPTETPFMNSVGRDSCSSTLTEWQTDALAAAASNAQLQGDDISAYDPVTPTVRVSNRTQISRKTAIVSGTQDAVDKAGRPGKEMSYQLAKKAKELKRDMEFNMVGLNQAGAPGNATTAPLLASLPVWIKTNTDLGATGANSTYVSGTPTPARVDGTQRAFTETILKNVLSLCFQSGAEPTILMVGAAQKAVVSGFSGVATRFRDVNSRSQAQIIGAADVYVGDFATLNVVPNRFQRNRDAILVDTKMAKTSYLRSFETIPLAKTGDTTKMLIQAEFTLKVLNEAAFGLAADLL